MLHYPRVEDNVCSYFEFAWFLDLEVESGHSLHIYLIIGVHALILFIVLVASHALVV